MSAVWRAARAAVRRRRLQTLVIALVVLSSTATIVVAVGLLAASSAPFDDAFNKQSGPHVVATFDTTKVSDGQLAQTRQQSGVEAAAGPFKQAAVTVPERQRRSPIPAGTLTVAGRADPGGPVDHLNLWSGRWATGPGEIVVDLTPTATLRPDALGATVDLTGGPTLTVVGYAYSVSETAGAWVSPAEIEALHPTSAQMLYRFTRVATDIEIRQSLATATSGLPDGSVVAAQSYLTLKQSFTSGPGAYVPFLIAFGVLGLVVAVLIVANVISGAVVSGFQHIGILKSLGFTPNQVVAIYLIMISVPAVVGAVLGTVLGTVLARPLLNTAFQGVVGESVGISLWVDVAALLGMPAVVVLAALIPALRAHGLSAAQAISAGATPRAGRALRLQRRLSGAPLPRSVSLGLGMPFARPGRTGLTMASIVLGVTTVTLATGLINTATAYGKAEEGTSSYQVVVTAGVARLGQTAPTHSDTETETLLRSLAGAIHVTPMAQFVSVDIAGFTQPVLTTFYRGDSASLGQTIVKGHWLDGSAQAVVSPAFLRQHGLSVGNTLTFVLNGSQAQATIVGETMSGAADQIDADWQSLATLAPTQTAGNYAVQLAAGTNVDTYIAEVLSADPGLQAEANNAVNSGTVVIATFSSLFTLLLAVVAALGVFNTVVLNTRERQRDLGMLKSIGMTPRQVTWMMVTSMAVLGVLGGLLGVPIGILLHRVIIPAMVNAAEIVLPKSMIEVWHAPVLGALALAGLLIAVLGAYIPARSAARLTIAKVLRNE